MAAGEPVQVARGFTPERPQPLVDAVPLPVTAANTENVSGSAQQPVGSVSGMPLKLGLGWRSTWLVNVAAPLPE